MTTATTRIERSGPAIRMALATFAPNERQEFEVDFQRAVAEAGRSFDLTQVEQVLDRWWGIANLRANPLTEREEELVARARAGDDSGWLTRGSDATRARR